MTDKKMQPASTERESQQVNTPFNSTKNQKEVKELQQTAKETKPAFQTYIYRSYGGGYQGL